MDTIARHVSLVLALIAVFCLAPGAAAVKRANFQAEGGGDVPLPFLVPDSMGNSWDIQPDGSIGDGGRDLYDGGGHLFIDGGVRFQSNGRGAVDAARHEVTLGPIPVKGLNISRRIAVNPEKSFCRWAEVVENPTNQKLSVSLRVHFDVGGSIQWVREFREEKGARDLFGVAIGDQRHCYGVIGAGRMAKVVPQIQPQQNNDNLNLTYTLEVPAKQTVVVVHVQVYRRNMADAERVFSEIKDKEYLESLPKDLQRKVVNFRVGDTSLGDREILRGDLLDVVELRGGDLLRGTLKNESYKLDAFYGQIELPAQRVAALFNVGAYRPRQLLVTFDGEVFGGQLARQALTLQLSSGQVMEIPLEHVSRAGYRRQAGESEEWTFTKPMVHLRSGERMAVRLPESDIDVSTRYGRLRLKPQSIASIVLASEESAAHRVSLRDGSEFAALVLSDTFALKLDATGQDVRFTAGSVARLQFAPRGDGPDDVTATLQLANSDLLVGSLTGQLKLDTTYDTLVVNCGEIRQLAHMPSSPTDVQITLWDDSLLQGNLREAQVACQTLSGATFAVPVSMISAYAQPRPRPAEAVVRIIGQLVTDLAADDWKARDSAQERLMLMGPVAISTLRGLRDKQPVEAQQRIDLIVQQLDAAGRKVTPKDSGSPPVPLILE